MDSWSGAIFGTVPFSGTFSKPKLASKTHLPWCYIRFTDKDNSVETGHALQTFSLYTAYALAAHIHRCLQSAPAPPRRSTTCIGAASFPSFHHSHLHVSPLTYFDIALSQIPFSLLYASTPSPSAPNFHSRLTFQP